MKAVAVSLILLAVLCVGAGVQGAMHSSSFTAQLGAFLPAALTLWMAIRVSRECYKSE
jgi:hypothetical protein